MFCKKNFIVMAVFCIMALNFVGCSSENSIVGTWKTVDDNYEITMRFYDDGTCLDVPYKTSTSADVESYKLQSDGIIIFTMEWDGTITVEPTNDEETALEDKDYYYFSGDKLIMGKRTFEKQ